MVFGRVSDRLYLGRSTLFKIFMLIGIVAISGFFIWYSFRLIDELKANTRSQVEKYVKLWELAINAPDTGSELQFVFDEIIVKAEFPIIVLDHDLKPVQWRNVPDIATGDSTKATLDELTQLSQELIADNRSFPIYFGKMKINTLCYGDPAIVRQLQRMPFIEIGVVVAFMIVGLIGFQSIRKSEERLIWVGMAKETAHQLGTPISSLLGWLELMSREHRTELNPRELDTLLDQTTENMSVDVTRLQQVANRFGLIGSQPELEPCDVNEIIVTAIEYYRRRLPFEGQGAKLEILSEAVPQVLLNRELFGWVLENLIKNALQAVDPRVGLVQVRISCNAETKGKIQIEVIDNGSGIPVAAQRKIFRAGFTTKKRGWGMGLTLVKRIVEEYHRGSIWLESSRPGETVFVMTLPAAQLSNDPTERGIHG